jgi:hypothetical protein
VDVHKDDEEYTSEPFKVGDIEVSSFELITFNEDKICTSELEIDSVDVCCNSGLVTVSGDDV